MEGTKLLSQKRIRTLGKQEFYLGILEVDIVKQAEMKEKIY